MPGLRWTTRGAVSLPETLQIRVAPSFTGRIQAGAPSPLRALTGPELSANIRWFTAPGPRGRPVSGLVLSGLDDLGGELQAAVALGRAASLRKVVVHTDGAALDTLLSSPLASLIDQLAVAVRRPEEAPRCDSAHLPIDVLIPLEGAVLAVFDAVLDAVIAGRPRRITFTWPFPGGGPPPMPAGDVAAVLGPALERVSLPWAIKGIPICTLASHLNDSVSAHVSRTNNRWYVDSEHQLERALLFLPDVLAFAKREACRFCSADDRCDGVAEKWLQAGLVPALVALRTGGAATATRVG